MSSLGFKISLIFRVVVSFFHAEAKKLWRIVEKRESHSSTGVTAKKNKKKVKHVLCNGKIRILELVFEWVDT